MSDIARELTLHELMYKNMERQKEWDPLSATNTPLYRAVELAGEAGEACNEVKKLERERLGVKGSRTTVEKLAEELADTIICCSLVANMYGINLDEAVVAKFNKTSDAVGLSVKL